MMEEGKKAQREMMEEWKEGKGRKINGKGTVDALISKFVYLGEEGSR